MRLTALAAILAFSIAPVAALAQSDPMPQMSLEGTGIVTAAPDLATVTTGVVTDGETAAEALAANTSAMAALIEVVKAAGIADRDVQTSGFSVQPRYSHSEIRNEDGYRPAPKIVGYRVSNNVSLRVRDLDALGGLLDKVVGVGSNTIGSITFGIDDTSELMNEARKRAMADAIAKATLYADAAGICLDGIQSISEHGGYQPQPQMMRAMASDMAMESAPVPVEAGELSLSVSVSVQWKLQNKGC